MKNYYNTFKEHLVYFRTIFLRSKKPRQLFFIILGIDLLFVGLHVYTFSLPAVVGDLKNLRLDEDFGYAEFFQYLKFISVSVLLLLTTVNKKKMVHVVWAIFFLVLFLDDAFSFHEDFGLELTKVLDITPALGLRAQDFGELAVSGVLGFIFVFPLAYSQFFSSKNSQFINMNYVLLFAVLIFFGVGIDMLHSLLEGLPGVGLLTIVEDGGEMLALSLILWYTCFLYYTRKLEAQQEAVYDLSFQN